MNAQRAVVATLVGGVLMYLLGRLIFDIAFGSFYEANAGSATGVARESQLIWAMLLGSLAYTALITFVIGRGGASVSVTEGARVGAIVGCLLWATVDFVQFGALNLNTLPIAIVDPLLEAVRGGIMGAVLTMMLGTKAPAASSTS